MFKSELIFAKTVPTFVITCFKVHLALLQDNSEENSVMDPFNFDTDPDPQIRFVEKRIRISPKIEKYVKTFLSADYPKNDLLLYKY